MRNFYFGWQMDMKNVPQSVSDALQRYYKKFGLHPHTIIVSDQLEEVPIPENMNLVIKVHRVPKNILMIGDDE